MWWKNDEERRYFCAKGWFCCTIRGNWKALPVLFGKAGKCRVFQAEDSEDLQMSEMWENDWQAECGVLMGGVSDIHHWKYVGIEI